MLLQEGREMLQMSRSWKFGTTVLMSVMCARAEFDPALKPSSTAHAIDFITQMGERALNNYLRQRYVIPYCKPSEFETAIWKDLCTLKRQKDALVAAGKTDAEIAAIIAPKKIEMRQDIQEHYDSADALEYLVYGVVNLISYHARTRLLKSLFPSHFSPKYFQERDRPWILATHVRQYVPSSMRESRVLLFVGGVASLLITSGLVLRYGMYMRQRDSEKEPRLFQQALDNAVIVAISSNGAYHVRDMYLAVMDRKGLSGRSTFAKKEMIPSLQI